MRNHPLSFKAKVFLFQKFIFLFIYFFKKNLKVLIVKIFWRVHVHETYACEMIPFSLTSNKI